MVLFAYNDVRGGWDRSRLEVLFVCEGNAELQGGGKRDGLRHPASFLDSESALRV